MDKSRKVFTRERYMPLTVVAFMMILACIMAACGFNGGTSTASGGSTPTPVQLTPTVTNVAGYGSAEGCPSDYVVSNLTQANVVTTLSGAPNPTVAAHTGDVIELRAPFGSTWAGPQSSIGNLTLQDPSGFAEKTAKACIWRFDAKSAGTTEVNFTSRPICKKGAMCAMIISEMRVTITVK